MYIVYLRLRVMPLREERLRVVRFADFFAERVRDFIERLAIYTKELEFIVGWR